MDHLRELNIPERTVNINIDVAKCTGPIECGKCLRNCPAAVFFTYPESRIKGEICNNWKIAIDDTFCWGCGICTDVCPKNAIIINEIGEES